MNWQEKVKTFTDKHDLYRPAPVYTLDLMSELGEVAKEILVASDYGRQPLSAESHPDLSQELGDVLYSLCSLATVAGVDLDTALNDALVKYEQRWQAKGHIGSH